MATTSIYTVKLPKILDIIEYNGFFNLPKVHFTITDRDTGRVLYDDVPSGDQISFSTAIGADLRLIVSKNKYITEGRTVHLGNPENNVYRFIKASNEKEIVLIALKRETGYCCSGEKLVDYVHAFYDRNFNNFTLTNPTKVLVSNPIVANNLTTDLNACLTTPISTPSGINDFKAGFVNELNDEDALHTVYVNGPSGENEIDLDYDWNSKHAYVFDNSFKLYVNEKNFDYLTFEAYNENVYTFSIKLSKYGNPNEASIQYRYFDKDVGKSINNTGCTTYEVTSTEMTQIRNSFATGKTCTIGSKEVRFTIYDRISYNGAIYDVEETENGGYRLVESQTDYNWTNYTFGDILTSNDNGIVIQFRRSPKDNSHYFSKDIDNFYYFDVVTGYVNVYGSVNTLLVYSDNITLDVTDDNDKYIFYRLFGYINSNRIRRVKDLKLKSTVLTEGCYAYMFDECDFTDVPDIINAQTLRAHSCESMFSFNSSLSELPYNFFAFSISNLYTSSYGSMFYGCTNLSLRTTQTITVDSCENYSCYRMFYNCISNRHCNINIGNKTALNIPSSAFYQMFYNNINANISFIKIKAGSVNNRGFSGMFEKCNKMYFPSDINEYYVSINGTIGTEGCANMFSECSNLQNTSITNLLIHTTNIGTSGCSHMFYKCLKLEVPIIFTHLLENGLITGSYCFSHMFDGCEKLTFGPSLRAGVLSDYACEYMFNNCKNISSAYYVLNTTGLTLGNFSCQFMFCNCSKLLIAPFLKNLILSTGCFSHMFENCELLKSFDFGSFVSTSIPNHAFEYMFTNAGIEKVGDWSNIITAGEYACQYMFSHSKLKYPPETGALTLNKYSYYHMFEYCDLYTDMKLVASNIPDYAYAYMFSNATINSFKKTFFVLNFEYCGNYSFSHMFYYTKSRQKSEGIVCGKFIIKRINCVNPYYVKVFSNRGDLRRYANNYNKFSNVRYYWALPYRDAFVDNDHIALVKSKMKSGSGADCLQTEAGFIDTIDLRYANESKFVLSEFLASSNTACTVYDTLDDEFSGMEKGEYKIVKKDSDFLIKFGSNTTGDYCCEYMFSHCDFAIDGHMVKFTGTKLGSHAFSHMFDGCEYLNSIPILNTINSLGIGSFEYMFANCKNLFDKVSNYVSNNVTLTGYSSKILELKRAQTGYIENLDMYYYTIFGSNITTVPVDCCKGMFRGCKNLKYGPVIQNITPGSGAYEEMFYNCNNLRTIRYEKTSAPTNAQFSDWVKNVNSSGIFSRATSWNVTYGDNGVPTGWEVQTD